MSSGPYTDSIGKYVVVDSIYDCLTAIACKYVGQGTSGYSDYKRIATLNNISGPLYLIKLGDKIYLTKNDTSTTTSPTTTEKSVYIVQFGQNSANEKELFVVWSWKDYTHTEKYKVVWTASIKSVSGTNYSSISEKDISVDEDYEAASRQDTFTIPDGATSVFVKIKPIAKKDDNDLSYFSAEWTTSRTFYTKNLSLSTPSVPTVEINGLTLTASLENINIDRATHIEFELVKDNAGTALTTKEVEIVSSRASHQFSISAGSNYKVRCRALDKTNSVQSDWSDYSDNGKSMPAAPTGFTEIRTTSETSVYLAWSASATATSYELQYTKESRYFDSAEDVTSKTGIENPYWEVTGLDSGSTYYFRVRAIDEDSNDESSWATTYNGEIASVIVGSKPAAPTTWSSTTTAIIGEPLTLYWTHNSEDGSYQTLAELELYIDGSQNPISYIFDNDNSISNSFVTYTPLTQDELEAGAISSCSVNTSSYKEGVEIEWRIRTAGILNEYGDWSTQRTITVYAPATLELSVTDSNGNAIDIVNGFPIHIEALPGPKTQAPLSYHLSVTSLDTYETTDNVGNPKIVNEGELVFSKHYDAGASTLSVDLSAGNLSLENTFRYVITCTVSMNSGLTAEESKEVLVSWVATHYTPNAMISIDRESMTATIRPYCENRTLVYYPVTYENDSFIRGVESCGYVSPMGSKGTTSVPPAVIGVYGETIYEVDGVNNQLITTTTYYLASSESTGVTTSTEGWTTTIPTLTATNQYLWCYQTITYTDSPPKTTDGYSVYTGSTSDGETIYFCMVTEATVVTGATMDIYRREFDGSFTKINDASVSTEKYTSVTDPHPALDYARYRIVAIDNTSGTVSYYDLPGYYVGGTSVIIQWSESWTNFETDVDEEIVQPTWSGSMLKLPYNIDVSDSNSRDISLVEYAGRENPVAYYGTQLGHQATWNVEIPKTDKETLYALRRLQRWMDDVYVREPSGSGYWASISVSFSQKHKELTIPVTLSLNKVEGGV